ncbi:hypothetical protein DFJ43DRAFT_6146 [Lentinula guzmanii]|uniref:Uncharacterized protein n=1 Tax=Lentinula guzmanii TaxID=2804957 RepID=A0AA38JSP8_9AGAR|nr:hypothetical protein DFJ43DRAFT_6146 [Lentinula guzmanii]
MQSGDPPTLDSSATSLTSPTTRSSPLSRKTSVSSQTETDIPIAHTNPASDSVLEVQHSVGMMHESLNALEQILQNLAEGQNSGLLADNGQLNEIEEIHKDLTAIQKNQVDGTEEIELLMKNFLDQKAVEKIEELVNQEIQRDMDNLVKEEVQAYLQSAISSELQKELLQRKKELDEAHCELHNSESKRLNSLLSERNVNEPLHNIYCSNGRISEHFPKTLNELFAYDADTCKTLVKDYNIDSPEGTSKRGNLNRFMVFCGLQLSMIANI